MKFLLLAILAAWSQTAGDQNRKSTYILGADDQIAIHVLDLEEFSEGQSGKDRMYRIDLRGMVNLPLVGRLHAAGQTVEQVEATLAERLKEYLKTPSVTVTVAEYKSQPISVIGQVQTPGVHQLQGRKSLLEVISVVGGLKPEAGHQIKITRKVEYGSIPLPSAKPDSTGQFSVAEVSVKRILNAESPEENIQIQPFDVISVPKAELVYVVGNVKRSGGIVLGDREKVTALQALSMAEGLDRDASSNTAKILRKPANGGERQEILVALGDILKGKKSDVPMEPDDILFVPSSVGKKVALRSLEAAISIGTGLAIFRR
ncbi:MAG: polysaccharide biosynthesis/export family protein [Acidobacteria bacterium]|nr:polysaccharide biosynthesis/export family protein [Acidobacteriota bacterium]